jgi:UDP-N-acetylmuramoyl-L-alanyl-D-glutamate--2,6-diaminopimelate ligase
MRFWGITGTNGKTTCTWIFAEFVNACPSRKCGYVTTVEVFDGQDRFYTGYTTPPLARLREIYAAMEKNGCTDCVMEVSSHAIHQNRTGDTVFSGGAFTNLSEDHLDYHKTMEEYFRVKASFAEKIAAAHPADPGMGRRDLPPYVVCLDGGYGREMFDAVANFSVNAIPVSVAKSGYDLSKLQLIGEYNRDNVLVSAALAEAAGVPHETVQRTVPELAPRWGRLEYVPCKSKAKVYVDFAHTPDGLEKVLAAVKDEMVRSNPDNPTNPSNPNAGSLWIVFGAGGDRDPMKRPLMGAACAKLADRLVVTSDNPRSEDPLAIIGQILEGVNNPNPQTSKQPKPPNTCLVEPDRRKAIYMALSQAADGDIVIVAGKGHETTQEIKGVKHPFDDREVVRAFPG